PEDHMNPPESGKDKPDCFRCRHFFVTWDRNFPRGCRALGFKSREMPHLKVEEASGMGCLKFERKETLPSGA
ncbi:MAG TPA: hypothetical protein VLS90_10435, partial [Thermodesulfobacteriota bacterium]|nr:hypothetical protein [Thermodesulfobacteriota bacterium]